MTWLPKPPPHVLLIEPSFPQPVVLRRMVPAAPARTGVPIATPKSVPRWLRRVAAVQSCVCQRPSAAWRVTYEVTRGGSIGLASQPLALIGAGVPYQNSLPISRRSVRPARSYFG
jgi:hypothetical protein